MVDTCIMCGEVVPEGFYICLKCEMTVDKSLTNVLKNGGLPDEETKPNYHNKPVARRNTDNYTAQKGKVLYLHQYRAGRKSRRDFK